jgi:outer membrane protein OmpA-like peptidoglycan-associated protein
MTKLKSLTILLVIIAANSFIYAQGTDAEGCKDHSMFNRMPNFYIGSCLEKDFDGHDFFTGKYNESSEAINERVEGKYFEIAYYDQKFDETSSGTSALQIFRNYENALKKVGAKFIVNEFDPSGSSRLVAVMKKDNMETWFDLNDCIDGRYGFVIVQKQLMEQVIQANEMLEALNKDGFIALDILFDTGKSTIKQESQPIVDQIYNLLKDNPSLNVSIEGHTDNIGNAADNKKLSDARAKAVMDALVAKGIAKNRLSSVGWGQEKPVADNRNEAGRAKNRRVEIVKK